ncbi:hypothetical protein BD779DRAFT_1435316 [Infundibulicybe gibba]|nr:hypothetical protein BD779DRAFT_1435316 [Infundibulicybe gibba]
MLTRLTRLSFRRCLHTAPPRPNVSSGFNRFGFTLGASAVAASYLTWHLTSEHHRIALDSDVKRPIAKPKAATVTSSLPTETQFLPDEPSEQVKLDSPNTSPKSSGGPQPPHTPGVNPHRHPQLGGGSGGGAYDPVTGEINWDCPCLGGMAHGPCGPEFREAFSCFVHSEDEPKGINCVEKFQAMQDCFRAHPEIYADEIMDDDEGEEVPSTTTEGVVHQEAGSTVTASTAMVDASTEQPVKAKARTQQKPPSVAESPSPTA